ncbi:N-(5'-phosphoribosyl)anthranilate isomerase [Planctomycetes bacterium Poly30]|uniref:N-(5'-phosphoribosyl)anthranilate isomerase n=1 Tax=Saltatorellus ferox TaxID=2528018 RepID=A0A518EV26_9BACT|nr:N-(5'-phosphoribosyl)anthranilate isomerase [Planctomycetes bacterium Poly30]
MTRFLTSLIEQAERPLAKVCGLTGQRDVELAAAAGADLLGLVSYPKSPRHLSDLQVVALGHIIEKLAARSVLVIVDADRAGVDRLVHEARLDAVQLCGMEEPGDWRNTSYGLLRRIGVDEHGDAELAAWKGIADAFVLDHPSSAGGSGRTVDPEHAAEFAREAPCFLAGGLDGDAGVFHHAPSIGLYRGFDASSRLEIEPGTKDPDRVKSFIDAAHRYSKGNAPSQDHD